MTEVGPHSPHCHYRWCGRGCWGLNLVLASSAHLAILVPNSIQLMDTISQLDIQNPDHVSVITREGKVTISVMKDGTSVTLGLPIRQVINTTPRPALQQDGEMALVKKIVSGDSPRRVKPQAFCNAKLSEGDVREIKGVLATPSIMKEFKSLNRAYIDIGKAYGVSQHTISNIHKGKAWAHIKA